MICQCTATDADGVDFLDVLSNGEEGGHRSERLSEIVCVKTGDNYPYASVGKLLNYSYDALVEELCFVNSDYFNIGVDLEHP